LIDRTKVRVRRELLQLVDGQFSGTRPSKSMSVMAEQVMRPRKRHTVEHDATFWLREDQQSRRELLHNMANLVLANFK
jgi:hypothetical protein